MVKSPFVKQETWVWFLGQENPLEKEMATHFNILAWEIPWIEEPGRLQSMGLRRVAHNLATKQGFPGGLDGKESACSTEDLLQSLGWEDSLKKGMPTHSSILA